MPSAQPPRLPAPGVRHPSGRPIQSHYRRRVRGLPWQGVAGQLALSVRRFFCAVPECPQRLFCARLSVGALPARRTVRLNQARPRLSLAVGGEGRARLAWALALSPSPDTWLRRIRQLPARPSATPRVPGIEDWAKRTGRS